MHKTLTALVAILAIGGSLYWYAHKNQPTTATVTITPDSSSAMRAEENMIVMTEQRPGKTIIASQVHLATPGFVVIHEDADGKPGAILGASALLPAGDSSQVKITVARPTHDGEKLHGMLHSDTDENHTYSVADEPVLSRGGGPIEGWFDISSKARTDTPVSI